MAVTRPNYDSGRRGQTDAARHREKIKEAIRQNLPDIISDEAIITRKENQILRVPIRGIKSYRFIHRQGEGSGGGFGSGESQKGKTLGQRPKPGHGQPGKPGEEPGVDYLETEINIEELINMMFDDLGLPNLRKKEIRESVIPKGWKWESLEKHGIRPRLDKKRTIKEAIKRTEVLVAELMDSTGLPEEECRDALASARGDLLDALAILRPEPEPGAAVERAPAALMPQTETGEEEDQEEKQRVYLDSSDLRYRTLTEDVEYRSNAVILAMMDVSGSMSTMKKYLARSFYFWMISFLRSIYKHVEIRFIAHTTTAKLVDEHNFFHKGESGGTYCYSAYDLALELIDTEYPTSRWNVYPFHFSDGEDWDVERTVRSLKAMLSRGVSAFGYGEIPGEYSSSVLMESYRRSLGLRKSVHDGFLHFEGQWSESPILGVVIRTKKDLYPALRALLRPEIGYDR